MIKFEVFAVDNPGDVHNGRSSSGAWGQILHTAYEIRNRQPTTAVCGPDLFGLTVAEIAMKIQDLPNANRCSRYKWQTFIPASIKATVDTNANVNNVTSDQVQSTE